MAFDLLMIITVSANIKHNTSNLCTIFWLREVIETLKMIGMEHSTKNYRTVD